MSNDAEQQERAPGTTTIAPNVLVTIAQLTALRVDGVARLAPLPASVNRLFRRGTADGVQIDVHEGRVAVDLYLVLESEINVREVSRVVQHEVARAIEEMVGMSAEHVNIHIQDIAYDDESSQEAAAS